MLRRRWVMLVLLVIALASTDFAARYFRTTMRPQAREPFASIAHPFPVPPFKAVDLDGREVSPERWRGSIVLVNFWATWCAPCRLEMPDLVALQDKYRGALLVVGVVTDPVTAGTAREFAAGLRVNYPIVPLTNEIEQSFSEAPVLPMTYLVDEAGRMVAAHAGRIDVALVEREIQTLVASRAGGGGSR